MKPKQTTVESTYTLENFTSIVGSSLGQVHVLDYNHYRPIDLYLDEFLCVSSALALISSVWKSFT